MSGRLLTASEVFGPDASYEHRLTAALETERVKREARRQLDAEARGAIVIPPFVTLRDWLAEPDLIVPDRIAQWQPQGTRVMLAAQFKSGKTTLRDNLIRSLVDGDPFLGRYDVTPIEGCVGVLDLEMGPRQLKGWFRAQRIRHDDQVIPISLKGRAQTFAIPDADGRADWAAQLKAAGIVYLIIDCVRPIIDALGLDEHRDAGRLLVAFDQLCAEAGITEALLIHHMGHLGERARGDSRLRDWPDVEWRLVRQDDNPALPRFVTAYGRDVDVPESQLEYDAATRRLTVSGGSRRDVQATAALADVVAAIAAAGHALSGRSIKAALRDTYARAAIEQAIAAGAHSGALQVQAGAHNARLYSVGVSVSRSVPPVSRDTGEEQSRPSTARDTAAPPMGISREAWLQHHVRNAGRQA